MVFGLQKTDPQPSIFDPKNDQNSKPKIKYDSERKKSDQDASRMPPRRRKRPNLVPKTAQEPPKRRPRRLKNRPRAAQEASRKRPIGALERRHATKQPQTHSRPRFGSLLDGFLEGCWKVFQINPLASRHGDGNAALPRW